MKQNKIHIYGKHAVAEAVANTPHIVRKIFVASKLEDKSLRDLIKRSGIPVEPLDPRRVTSQVEGNAAHQGVVALIAANELEIEFATFLETFEATPDTLLVLLGEVQDPHNVGALIRSAAAFGATAVLIPVKKQAAMTPAAIKASAGMAFRVPLVSVPLIQEAISLLKKKGVRVYGFSGDGAHSVTDEAFRAPTLLVFGNEGTGIPGPVKGLCDLTLSIPMHARAESLNVAASGAVAMYAWSVRHQKALKGLGTLSA